MGRSLARSCPPLHARKDTSSMRPIDISIPQRLGVAPGQRFTAAQPCPVCGGYSALPHGLGIRCYGYLSDSGSYAYCTREQYAGNLEQSETNGAYCHRLDSPCDCGIAHQPSERPALDTEYPAGGYERRTGGDSTVYSRHGAGDPLCADAA